MYYIVIQMIGEFEYLILTSVARLGAERLRRFDPQGDRESHRAPMLDWGSLYNSRPFGDEGLRQDMDG